MKKIIIGATCLLMLSTTFAAAQSSQGKGGAPMTSESADPAKTPGAMSQDKMGTAPMKKDGMSGTTGMSNDNMKKDGMAKDGMAKDGMKK